MFVCVCVCVCVGVVSTMKLLIGMTCSNRRRYVDCRGFWFGVRQGPRVIISNFWCPIHISETDGAFKFYAQIHYARYFLPADQKLCRNEAGITEYNSL